MMGLLQPTRVAALLLAAMVVLFGAGGWRLGLWGEDGPGPGLLPFSAALMLAPLVLLMLRERIEEETPFGAHPLGAIVMLCLYAAALPHTGFVLPTLLLILAWVRLFHAQAWLKAALVSAALTAAGVGLFAGLLKAPVPLLPVWP